MTFPVKHISLSVNASAVKVYEFASDPGNLPKWASGLSDTIQKVDGDWLADSPMGKIKIRFVAGNPFGVLDHDVTLPTGETFHNPMRVVPNGDGCELLFTLYRQGNVTDEQFREDAATIEKDFRKLKELVEN